MIQRHINKFRFPVYKSCNQPGAGEAVDFRAITGDPFYLRRDTYDKYKVIRVLNHKDREALFSAPVTRLI